jgi:ribosomal protein S18 acetylase RimI-like enzyme
VIAWAGEEIAGACYNDFSPLRTLRAGSPQGYVESLSVRRPWRKRGIATAMLVWTLHEALTRGLKAVSLGVDAENPNGAKQLYERVGFREIDRFPIYGKRVPVSE